MCLIPLLHIFGQELLNAADITLWPHQLWALWGIIRNISHLFLLCMLVGRCMDTMEFMSRGLWSMEGLSLSCCIRGQTVLLAVRVGAWRREVPVSGEMWAVKCLSRVR